MILMGLSQQSAGYKFISQNTADNKNEHTQFAKLEKSSAANIKGDK